MTLQTEDFESDKDRLEVKIAAYLIEHPDFLLHQDAALAALSIPHVSGDAISLVERQVKTLRAQNKNYHTQLEELILVARENEAVAQRMHLLTLALIETSNFDEVLNTLQDKMRDLFQADAVEMKLFSQAQIASSTDEISPVLFQDFINESKPSCGSLNEKQLNYLFGSQAKDAASVALIPIQSLPQVGILAIGSRDSERFASGKRVDFLNRLAEVVSAALIAGTTPEN